ncbi:hypothetical protein B0H13DRAFT_2365619 [Mycena leptocephala]|nr:hypothetical protein B0H13DRAFT_2365619 [Mycena leptocephala]
MASLKTSKAKREAQARYRARNKDELRRKAREAMAQRRAKLSPAETIEYRMTAREDAARYRADNHALLAQKALVGRARDSIAKIGYEEWSAKYKLRHKRPIPAILQVEYGPPDPPNVRRTRIMAPPAQSPSSPSPSATSSTHPLKVPQTRPKPKPSSSLPPSSAPCSTSSSMRDWIDRNLTETPNADLIEDSRRRERHAECEDSHTKVQAWLPRTIGN